MLNLKNMFSFKGNRKYIHSTDIISYFSSKYSNFKNLDIKFNKLIKNEPIIIKKKLKKNDFKFNSIVNFQLNKKKSTLIIKETKKKITNSYSYDENLLNQIFKIRRNEVIILNSTTTKNIDLAVSMSKFFCEKRIGRKKWLVYRIYIIKNINKIKYKTFKVLFTKNLKNKIFIFEIIIDNKYYGNIYYSFK